jgi:hypothetical protein
MAASASSTSRASSDSSGSATLDTQAASAGPARANSRQGRRLEGGGCRRAEWAGRAPLEGLAIKCIKSREQGPEPRQRGKGAHARACSRAPPEMWGSHCGAASGAARSAAVSVSSTRCSTSSAAAVAVCACVSVCVGVCVWGGGGGGHCGNCTLVGLGRCKGSERWQESRWCSLALSWPTQAYASKVKSTSGAPCMLGGRAAAAAVQPHPPSFAAAGTAPQTSGWRRAPARCAQPSGTTVGGQRGRLSTSVGGSDSRSAGQPKQPNSQTQHPPFSRAAVLRHVRSAASWQPPPPPEPAHGTRRSGRAGGCRAPGPPLPPARRRRGVAPGWRAPACTAAATGRNSSRE